LIAIKHLKKEGIHAGVNFIPIVPYLLDNPENMEEVIKNVSKYAEYVLIGSGMTLRSNQRTRFMELLKRNFPELLEKYENLYKQGMSPTPNYMLKLNQRAWELCQKYGIQNYITPPSFQRWSQQQTLIPKEDYFKENLDMASNLLLVAFFKEFKSSNMHSSWKYHQMAENIENLEESIRNIYERAI
jgi:DNA repair photolyase